jgi:hypothetical protein
VSQVSPWHVVKIAFAVLHAVLWYERGRDSGIYEMGRGEIRRGGGGGRGGSYQGQLASTIAKGSAPLPSSITPQ